MWFAKKQHVHGLYASTWRQQTVDRNQSKADCVLKSLCRCQATHVLQRWALDCRTDDWEKLMPSNSRDRSESHALHSRNPMPYIESHDLHSLARIPGAGFDHIPQDWTCRTKVKGQDNILQHPAGCPIRKATWLIYIYIYTLYQKPKRSKKYLKRFWTSSGIGLHHWKHVSRPSRSSSLANSVQERLGKSGFFWGRHKAENRPKTIKNTLMSICSVATWHASLDLSWSRRVNHVVFDLWKLRTTGLMQHRMVTSRLYGVAWTM